MKTLEQIKELRDNIVSKLSNTEQKGKYFLQCAIDCLDHCRQEVKRSSWGNTQRYTNSYLVDAYYEEALNWIERSSGNIS